MTNAAVLLRKDSKKWSKRLRFPVRGVALTGSKEQVRWRMIEEEVEDDDDDSVDVDLHEQLCFRDVACTGGDAVNGTNHCNACLASKPSFIRRCVSNSVLRAKPLSSKTNNRYLRTMSLQQTKIDDQRHKLELTQKQKKYYKDLYKDLSDKGKGVKVPINDTTKAIFSHENTKHLEEWLGGDITKKSTAKYLFEEACRKHKVAEQSGATAVQHCPLTYRLGIVIRKKMGYAGGLYDLLQMGLPTDRSLNE